MTTAARERVTVFLASWGLDATQISADGYNDEGYWKVLTTRDEGKKFVLDGEVAKAWRQWPGGFPVHELDRMVHEAWLRENKGHSA